MQFTSAMGSLVCFVASMLIGVSANAGAPVAWRGDPSWKQVVVDASKLAGSTWGQKVWNAIHACPPDVPCFVDARNVQPVGVSSSLWLRSDLTIAFGPGTYQFAYGQRMGLHPTVPGVYRNLHIYGQGRDATVLKFLTDGTHCILVFGEMLHAPNEQRATYLPAVSVPKRGGKTFHARPDDLLKADLSPGDIIILGDRGVSAADDEFDFIGGYEWKEVAAVHGNAVQVKTAFERDYGSWGRAVWTKNTVRIENFELHDLTVDETARRDTTYPPHTLYIQNTRFTHIYNTRLQGWTDCHWCGLFAIFENQDLVFDHNLLRPFGTRTSIQGEMGGAYRGVVANNEFACGLEESGGLDIDYGGLGLVVAGNRFTCPRNRSITPNLLLHNADGIKVHDNDFASSEMSDTQSIAIYGASNVELRRNRAGSGPTGARVWSFYTPTWRGWKPNTSYANHACVTPIQPAGWIFCAKNRGVSGGVEPAWNTSVQAYNYESPGSDGAETYDGTVTWVGDRFHPTDSNVIRGLWVDKVTTGIEIGSGVVSTTVEGLCTGPGVLHPLVNYGGPGALIEGPHSACYESTLGKRSDILVPRIGEFR